MIIGFTGTHEGMSLAQYRSVIKLLSNISVDKFIHGDCVGADTNFHKICRIYFFNKPIKIRPSTSKTREYNEGAAEVCEPKPPLVRDHDIVDESDQIIACPKSDNEELRSGTWATVRYAHKKGKTVTIIYPCGNMVTVDKNAIWPNHL